jgi:hypothetical protein
MELAKGFLKSIFEHNEQTSLSRRDALASLGLAGLLLAAPKLLGPGAAEARALEVAGSSPVSEIKPRDAEVARADGANAADAGDATDLSARRYWRRHYWHRRYWRRRYWHRRYWRRRYWRHRYWRRRYWRRRYW